MPEVCGTGLGNFPVPGDPDMNSGSLTATAKNDGIDVTWTYPTLLAHAVAHTLLYRSTSSSFSTGVESSPIVVSGNYYFHQVPLVADTTYYYWIRIVSVNGTVGDLIGPASATMLPSHEFIVNTLVGQIQESQLTALLRSRIDLIDVVASDLLTEGVARLASDSAFSALLTQQIADLAAVDTLISNEVIQRTTADSALVVQMNAIAATASGNTGLIFTEQSVRATADSVIAQDILNLGVTFQTDIAAAILQEQTVRVTADQALATSINNVSVAYQAGDAANSAAIANEITARATADGAIASSVSTLQSTVGTNTTAIQTTQSVTNGLVGEYAVRIDANGHVAGFGLLNNGTSSQFIVNADKFAIVKPGVGTAEVPFVIGTVAGATRIVLNAATYIGDAQISTLNVAGNAVTVQTVANQSSSQQFGVGNQANWVTIVTATFDPAGGGYVATYTGQMNLANDAQCSFRMLAGTTVVKSWVTGMRADNGSDVQGEMSSVMTHGASSTGSLNTSTPVTITVQGKLLGATVAVTVANAVLTIDGSKR